LPVLFILIIHHFNLRKRFLYLFNQNPKKLAKKAEMPEAIEIWEKRIIFRKIKLIF
jgi:hypothetical protein